MSTLAKLQQKRVQMPFAMTTVKYLILFCFFFQSFLCFAQPPQQKLEKWGDQQPIEKIYLHFDRQNYLAGQTIWFKAYSYASYNSNTAITAIYTELVSPYAGVIARQTFPVARGISQGQFDLPDTLTSGTYIIRAYSATMLNNDPEFITRHTVFITGNREPVYTNVSATKKIRMEFFPEGGNFVAGRSNTVAFKATDEVGYPVQVNGILKNSKGESITAFNSYHDGMGMIDIEAQENQGYYVVLDSSASAQKYYLPATASQGVVFRLLTGEDGIHFEISQQKNTPLFNVAYMIGQMQHHVVFSQPFKEGGSMLKGVIKTNNLASGILHITLFNKDGIPLAERLSFVNNKEYIQKGSLILDTVNVLPRGRNRFTVSLADTVVGSFSVAVTDPDYDIKQRSENIYSGILLTSDIKGYVHNPAYYFSSNSDSVKYALDLVMMTNGWRRFAWKQLLNDSMPAAKYKDPAFVTLSGRVILEGSKKPFADKELLVYIVMPDSSRTMNMVKTDANGYYHADSLLFFGKASILFSDIRGKKSKFVDIKPGPDSLNRFYPVPIVSPQLWQTYQGIGYDLQKTTKNIEDYKAFMKANGLVLSEVYLKSKKKTALELLEEKYTSGAFSGESRRSFDLLSTDDASIYTNIFDFLQSRVPGLVTGRTETGEYFAYFRQNVTISALGNQGMDIFLDEVPADATTVAFIHPSQIAMVKVYSNFIGSTGGGAGGAIAVYLKKGEDLFKSLPSAGEVIRYSGYSVIKEFYAPDYSLPIADKATADHRTTLQWLPDNFVSGVNQQIPVVFYNNDRSSTYKIVVEGMTIDGKMLLIEKTVTGKAF